MGAGRGKGGFGLGGRIISSPVGGFKQWGGMGTLLQDAVTESTCASLTPSGMTAVSVPVTAGAGLGVVAQADASRGKILISCRSHYFRDVWSQNSCFSATSSCFSRMAFSEAADESTLPRTISNVSLAWSCLASMASSLVADEGHEP